MGSEVVVDSFAVVVTSTKYWSIFITHVSAELIHSMLFLKRGKQFSSLKDFCALHVDRSHHMPRGRLEHV
jgi:hypothetical protein